MERNVLLTTSIRLEGISLFDPVFFIN